jgi:hypothetical protein
MFRFLIALVATVLIAQQPPPPDQPPAVQAAPKDPTSSSCVPMDPDVRAKEPASARAAE